MQPQSKQRNFIKSTNAKENNVIQCTVLWNWTTNMHLNVQWIFCTSLKGVHMHPLLYLPLIKTTN